MASFYSNSSGESYMLNQTLVNNNKVYDSSISLSYPNLLSGHELVESDAQMYSKEPFINSEQISQYHGLSLTLGSHEEPSMVHHQFHSDLNHYANSSSLCSLLNSENALKNVQYLSFDLSEKTRDASSFIMPSQNFTGTSCNSKYLKAAQDLLDELVSVHKCTKLSEKVHNFDSLISGQAHVKRDDGVCVDLSPSERNDMQNKLTALFSMLDEVDRRYKQYWHQMQVMSSSFDTVAGSGAALPYTALALRTISRQFRCLRDGIKKQIQATQRILGGEHDGSSHSQGVLSRLRHVDQQLRQQKSISQFGGMRQPWRPQRGLPENAVSVLRAWLFEHFLHPYPKDSEKIVLARETGLTRSQVANWFINARVRLWKPMIEEMYKEEFGDAETEARSSPTTQEVPTFDELRDEEFRGGSLISAAEDENGVFVNFGPSHMDSRHIVNVGDGFFSDKNNASPPKNQVSLALGLQNSEEDSKLIFNGIQPKGNEGDSSSSSVPLDKLEYYYVDPVNNNQSRFGNNTHLMSDFVA
ncbi:hypothetical protein ABFS82_03G063600 [Erythranthe guttata]|uniref:BEL1-like homeodomain protein 7 n=1 Tax=Erythranthe guttata TaxID=4155 RepID=UPI00064E0CE6|nr:PREDICTED: BEL1-like homeodomain protein 7 [Erythranthe guttata]|eukprot:XP_012842786.1 PREDICTED: BEL1-like homeodomain protein 7 [Erythranthe guttata]